MVTLNAGKNTEKLGHLYIARGNVHLADSYKIKHT